MHRTPPGKPRRLVLTVVLQRDVGVRGDDLADLGHRDRDGIVEVVGAQVRHHLAADIPHFAVGQDAFQPKSHVDLPLVIVDGQQDQDAAVGALLADLPLVFKAAGIILPVIAIERMHRDHRNLRIGLGVVKLAADVVDAGDRRRREHMSIIADVIGRLGQVLDPFGGENRGGNQENNGREQPETSHKRAI